jgi:predicted PurR-regulated permease PerM
VIASNSITERGNRVAIGVLALTAAVALLYYGRILVITVIISAIIAFLLEPLVELFMRIRMPRGLASFLVCSIALVFLYFAGLGIYTESQLMANDLPAYGARINEIFDNAAARMERFETGVYRTIVPRQLQDAPPVIPAAPPEPPSRAKRAKREPDPSPPQTIQEVRVRPEPTPLLVYAYNYVRSVYSVLLMASFVPFLVYFFLAWGDHLRSRLLSSLEGESLYTTQRVLEGVGSMVRAYVVGNFLLGIFLTVASGILFAAVRLPYWPLVAPLSGFLSLVPYIGLPLAMIPPVFAALPSTGEPAVYLFLCTCVALLHLFALNLLYPKFVGSRVHLNPVVATMALMFWGMLWGAIGLLLAIPITAGVKAVCDNVQGLQRYGKMLGD